MPLHSHNHADNSFSSLYSLNWLRNRGLSIEFTIPALLLGELNQPGMQPGPVWSNGLPHIFPPGILTSSHPIPGRPAGRVPLDCSLYGGKGELLCSEDKLLLQRDGASHVRIMTLNTLPHWVKQWFSTCGLQTGSVSIALKLIRNADLWSPTQTNCNGILLGVGPRSPWFKSLPGDSIVMKGWESVQYRNEVQWIPDTYSRTGEMNLFRIFGESDKGAEKGARSAASEQASLRHKDRRMVPPTDNQPRLEDWLYSVKDLQVPTRRLFSDAPFLIC